MNDFSAFDLLQKVYRLVFPDLKVSSDVASLCSDLSRKAFGKAPRTWRGSLSGGWVTGFVCDSTAPREGAASQGHSLIQFTLRYAVPKLIEPDHSRPGFALPQHAFQGTLTFNQDGDIWWMDEGGGLNSCVNGIAKPRKEVADQLLGAGVSFRPAMKKREVAAPDPYPDPKHVIENVAAEPIVFEDPEVPWRQEIVTEAVEVFKVDCDVGEDERLRVETLEHEKAALLYTVKTLREKLNSAWCKNSDFLRHKREADRGERILRDHNGELQRRLEYEKRKVRICKKIIAKRDDEIAALLAENNRLSVKIHNLERGEADEPEAPTPDPEVWFITGRDLKRANKEPQGLGAGVGETKSGWPGMEE